MQYALTTKQIANQAQVIRDYGDGVWSWLCDYVRPGEIFTPEYVRACCPMLSHLSPRSGRDYARVVLLNVLAEYANLPDTPPIRKFGKKWIMT